jgi:hypothetical protein
VLKSQKGSVLGAFSVWAYTFIMVKKIKPELWFYYSDIYERAVLGDKYTKLTKEGHAKVRDYRNKLQKTWDKQEREIFDTIAKVSGLDWCKPCVDCYLVRNVIPFSRPMTIRLRESVEYNIENVIHELIHDIIEHEPERATNFRSSKYGKLDWSTRIHVLVHAIEHEVLFKLYSPRKAKEKIERWYLIGEMYKKAWEIVHKEGAKKIIKDCIKK